MSSVRPRVVLVSGGSRGLGQAIVKQLLGDGCSVATFSRQASDFVEEQRRADPGQQRFLWEPIDAADVERVHHFALEVARRFGAIDALVNNAALERHGVLGLMSADEIAVLLDVNLRSVIHLSRACARVMIQQEHGGSIINISSVTGLRGFRGLSVYGATKAALDGFTRGLARELGSRGIRVNSVAPGYLETELVALLSRSEREQILRRTPLGRLGTVEDVVGVVGFLLSPAAAFITGQTLIVDGGITC